MRRVGKVSPNDQSLLRMGTAAAVALALGLVLTGAAMAADLYPGEQRPHAGSPYDDPRYAELYGPEKEYDRGGRERSYRRYESRPRHNDYEDPETYRDKQYTPSPKRGYAYKQNHADEKGYDTYKNGYAAKKDYGAHDRRYDDHRGYANGNDWRKDYGVRENYGLGEHCVPRRQVLRQLRRQGWYNFTDLKLRGRKATVRADNESGDQYHLVIQRCSGEVLWADRIERRHRRHSGWRSAYGAPGYR